MLHSPLKIAVLSDVHLGHRRTPTASIIEGLMTAIPDTSETSQLDLIVISGDLFDRFLYLADEDVYHIHQWMSYLLRLCKRRDIVLRVLEGTPSHDWKQSRLLDSINKHTHIGADAKFVKSLSIERISKWDIDILYIPDEWNPDNETTWQQVKSILADHEMDQVDFVIMHGAFPYQLPDHVNVPTHDPDRYADIARHYVICGHVHLPSWYRNILVPGSFDRLIHGDEGAKGHWRLTIVPGGDNEIVFVENIHATIYRTLNIGNLSHDDALKHLISVVDTLPLASHVRVQGNQSDVMASVMEVLRQSYRGLHWTVKTTSVKTPSKTIQDMRSKYQSVRIDKSSIVTLVRDRLIATGCDATLASLCVDALKQDIQHDSRS